MGWTKGKSRKTHKAKAKIDSAPEPPQQERGLSWRAKVKAESADWRDESSDNLFSLPPHVHDWLNDRGLTAQWNVETVYGQPIESLMPTGDMRKYWEPVMEGDLPNFQGVERGGCRLYVRPKQLQDKAEEHRERTAKSRLREHEQGLLGGNLGGVTLDPRHASARGSNRVRHGYERVMVTGDD